MPRSVQGAADVTIFGEKRYAMRIWLNLDRVAQLGVTAAQVQAAIAEQNQQVVGGKLGEAPSPPGQQFELLINTLGRLSDVKHFEDIVVRAGNASSAMVRLKDLGRVELGAQSYFERLPQWQADCVAGGLPDTRCQRARARQAGPPQDGGAVGEFSARDRL